MLSSVWAIKWASSCLSSQARIQLKSFASTDENARFVHILWYINALKARYFGSFQQNCVFSNNFACTTEFCLINRINTATKIQKLINYSTNGMLRSSCWYIMNVQNVIKFLLSLIVKFRCRSAFVLGFVMRAWAHNLLQKYWCVWLIELIHSLLARHPLRSIQISLCIFDILLFFF